MIKAENIVYTTILGGYDTVKEPYITPGWDYYLITDTPPEETSWNIIQLPKADDPARKVRELWHRPEYFFNYERCIMIGGQIEIKADAWMMWEKYMNGYDLAVQEHPKHKTVTEEAAAIMRNGQADKRLVLEAMSMLRKQYSPTLLQLAQLGVIFRTRKADALFKLLDELVRDGCHRNQIYFPFCAWKNRNVKINLFKDDIYNNGEFEIYEHIQKNS